MAWREALDAAPSAAEVDELANAVAEHRQAALTHLQQLLDDTQDHSAAAQQVRALMFVERFAQDIDQRLEALGQ